MYQMRDGEIRTQLITRRERLKETIAESRTAEQLIALLKEVEAALERIDDGRFGICEVCHEPIEEDHLRENPVARICLAHLSEDQQRAIERDLDLAYKIQDNLLPPQSIVETGWEIYYRYAPAGPVSGDYCDIIIPEKETGSIYVVFGDISGKGVSASLLMSHIHAIFRSIIPNDMPLARTIERANRVFSGSTLASHFATLVLARLSPAGSAEICNAGHCRPILVNGGSVKTIESTGLPIGLFYNAEYTSRFFTASTGDTLLLYTDGLTEARNPSEDEYGEDRLMSVISRHRTLEVKSLIDGCLDDLNVFQAGHSRTDDLTIMAVRRSR